ncbi:MAG: hypothetical protein RSB38_03510 [Oscillospiraceae bacterium]
MKKILICGLVISMLVIGSTTVTFARGGGRHNKINNTDCPNYTMHINGECPNEDCTYPICTPKLDGSGHRNGGRGCGNGAGRGMQNNPNCIYN